MTALQKPPQSLSTLLTSLTTSLNDALECLPQTTTNGNNEAAARQTFTTPPEHGISLLDTKNELFLEYLRNFVFLMLVKIRRLRGGSIAQATTDEEDNDVGADNLQQDIVKHLVRLRVYLEKGVRPLEGRLKYQVDKVVRAAEDAERGKGANGLVKETQTAQAQGESGDDSDGSDDSDSDGSGSDNDSSDDAASATDNHDNDNDTTTIDDLSYRPNPSAFRRPSSSITTQTPAQPTSRKSRASPTPDTGIYRPPRINPTAMPSSTNTLSTTTPKSTTTTTRRPQKSNTLDEYITHELSTAPLAEPSIGSTIVSGGRRMASDRERREDAERRAYEESNLVRLPALSKKELAQRNNARGGHAGQFGGEDFRSIGESVSRIGEMTKGAGKRGSKGALDRSRKRARETVDGVRGSGVQGGEMFERKKRKFFGKGR
ncbi:hypothetical protein EJ05DRAFT_537164 [Pseudovirgaria hyperparasitica]|uniref:Uncharacterized protein n=1 Tax=Pseudovirgaria hyperparasitica TaxID=470096 RepID=A0A6A6WFS4_9PEZI|nr:uncharacterized protein EJ05DRAFT_537164 [Pseudovirgaria hyperparasitica]KAF2759981.1 hypothetical protein EJ05DRAFT_537164 [Pseudovirgaria hyperparasitica]